MKKIGVVRWLGTNCDRDVANAIHLCGLKPQWLWYADSFEIESVDAIILPGGFSYGDYLRAGALAAKAPVMNSVARFAKKGGPVLGICNGFQILCETQLLPGVLLKNRSLRFIDRWVVLECVQPNKFFGDVSPKKTLSLPIAHGQGCYYAPEYTLKNIEDRHQIWLRYLDNPNGSLKNIAGITNRQGNVAGLMPHPERAMMNWMGGEDGLWFFKSLQSLISPFSVQ